MFLLTIYGFLCFLTVLSHDHMVPVRTSAFYTAPDSSRPYVWLMLWLYLTHAMTVSDSYADTDSYSSSYGYMWLLHSLTHGLIPHVYKQSLPRPLLFSRSLTDWRVSPLHTYALLLLTDLVLVVSLVVTYRYFTMQYSRSLTDWRSLLLWLTVAPRLTGSEFISL